MFQTVFPSIIRSSRLYIEQQAYVKQILLLLDFGITVHVSDGLSVHHQEFTTVHTATGICQTDTATA